MSAKNPIRFAPGRRRSTWGRGETALALVVGLGLALWGCAERETQPGIQPHSPDWNHPASVDFHGLRVAVPVAPDPCKT